MKVNITVDMTPEEAKNMLNLPDLSGIIEEKVKEQLDKFTPNITNPMLGFWENPLWKTSQLKGTFFEEGKEDIA